MSILMPVPQCFDYCYLVGTNSGHYLEVELLRGTELPSPFPGAAKLLIFIASMLVRPLASRSLLSWEKKMGMRQVKIPQTSCSDLSSATFH